MEESALPTYGLKPGCNTIGRSDDRDIVLPSPSVSRHHAEMMWEDGKVMVRHTEGRNPTLWNEVALATGDQRRIRNGDVLRFGDIALRLVETPEGSLLATLPPEFCDTTLLTERAETALGTLKTHSRRLAILLDLVDRIGQDIAEPEKVAHTLLVDVARVLKASGGAILVKEPADRRPRTLVFFSEDGKRPTAPRSLWELLAQGREAFLWPKDGPSTSETLVREGVAVAAAAPIAIGSRMYGALYLYAKDPTQAFSRDGLRFAAAAGRLAAVALGGALELTAARRDAAEAKLAVQILGQAPSIAALRRDMTRLAVSDLSVIILGENGTGKGLVARALHDASPRCAQPFVDLNCAAIPRDLVESELFGHTKGSFTGAVDDYDGRLVQAHDGTLFLDEIGDMPSEAQAKILKVIESQQVTAIGAKKSRRVNVRFITATNKDIESEIEQGRFRRDLYYRLKGYELTIPPLRDRTSDIPLLADEFVRREARARGLGPRCFSEAALARLQQHPFKGNVRELEQLCKQLCLMADGPVFDLPDLPPEFRRPPKSGSGITQEIPTHAMSEAEAALRRALQEAGYNATKAAALLRITRDTLYRRMAKYGIKVKRGT